MRWILVLAMLAAGCATAQPRKQPPPCTWGESAWESGCVVPEK